LPQDPEFQAEHKAGAPSDMFGTNQHFSYPSKYEDFGRRFVPQYPYKEVSNTIDLILIDPQSVGKRTHDLMDTVNAKKRWKTGVSINI
jgi:hypothetical protein